MSHNEITMEQGKMSKEKEQGDTPLYFVRLNFNERVQHMIFVVSFIVLAATGFMVWIPETTLDFLGGAKETVFTVRGVLHRMAGTAMIIVSAYHFYYLIFKRAGRRWLFDMMPRPKDIKEFIHNMLYYIEVKEHPPEFDRFSYKHKMEYLALIVGTGLMSASGLILWAESFWDKFIIDIAALIHGMEAVLACLAVMVWHMYEVHLRPHKFPGDNMWLTGIIDEAEMKEEYPLHYKRIMSDPKLRKIYLTKGPKQDE